MQGARRRLLGAAAAWAWAPKAPAQDSTSLERLRQLMQARAQALGPQRSAERAALLARAERQLAAGELDAAVASLDAAALMLHAPDTELALVGAYMQRGEYRRAVSFGAHAAGAHREVPAGAVLYAWLLWLGGQAGPARALLDGAAQLHPAEPLLAAARAQLEQAMPDVRPLATPVRLAPWALGPQPPAGARVVGSATRLPGAAGAALAPAALRAGSTAWLRDGLGRTWEVSVHSALPGGLLLLQGTAPDDADVLAPWAPRTPFPGSPLHAVEHGPGDSAAWPRLHLGFAGAPQESGVRELGVVLAPGPRGGPVLDAQGRLVGLAQARPGAADRLVGVDLLAQWLEPVLGPDAVPRGAASATRPVPLDDVYERGLRLALQLIVPA